MTEVGLGDAKTAFVANARVNSAAVARTLDGQAPGSADLAKPLVQQAPPDNDRGAERRTAGDRVGPLTIGDGQLTAQAHWAAGMACGRTGGEAARASASLGRVDLLRGRGGALVGVPEEISSQGTTAVERSGSQARTVASATVAAQRLTLAGGRIRLRVLRAPTLTVCMSTVSGGEVRYRPATIEVSGPGVATRQLTAAGEAVEFALGDDTHAAESLSLGALSSLARVRPGLPAPLPTVPGLPSVGSSDTESAPAVGPGTRVRISLGDVRQATKGHAIAAKATAIKIAITQGAASDGRGKHGYGDKARAGVVAQVGIGMLEAAAVAPETAVAGTGGGLPVTGPRIVLVAAGGAGLLVTGVLVLVFGMRRRRSAS